MSDQPEPLQLSGQQRALYEALLEKEQSLADMYIGSLLTLYQTGNPDSLALAAHGLRELMEKLPRYLNTPIDVKSPSLKGSFDRMPEVQNVLDEHLKHDTAPAIRAVYGQWLPQLASLDQEWVTAHVSEIFPVEEPKWELRDAAWETYIIFCPPYTGVFNILQEEYRRAVERLGKKNTKWRNTYNPEEHLAEHLMIFYAHGSIALDEPGSLITNFYEKASDELKGYTIENEGRRLCDTREEVPPEILGRLKAFWEYRLAEAKAASSSSSHMKELAAFGWWFTSGKFEDGWALDQFTEVLRIVGTVDSTDRDVVERLADLVSLRPKQVVTCLRLMVERAKETWRIQGWRDYPRKILQTAIQGSDPEAQQAAIDLIHQIGKRGHFEYRELLPREAQ